MTEQNNNIRDAQASQRDAINKVPRTDFIMRRLLTALCLLWSC